LLGVFRLFTTAFRRSLSRGECCCDRLFVSQSRGDVADCDTRRHLFQKACFLLRSAFNQFTPAHLSLCVNLNRLTVVVVSLIPGANYYLGDGFRVEQAPFYVLYQRHTQVCLSASYKSYLTLRLSLPLINGLKQQWSKDNCVEKWIMMDNFLRSLGSDSNGPRGQLCRDVDRDG
jgi:hypothetical protein